MNHLYDYLLIQLCVILLFSSAIFFNTVVWLIASQDAANEIELKHLLASRATAMQLVAWPWAQITDS